MKYAPHPTQAWAIVLAVTLLGGTLVAQQPVISFERGTSLLPTYPFIRFSTLASFDVPYAADIFTHAAKPQLSNQALEVPAEVKALHGTTISVRGYMLPITVTKEGVRKFILTATMDACHWGMIGLANEWMVVEMAKGTVPYVRMQPVVMFGRLSVEPQWRGTTLAGLYQLRADYILTDGP